MKQYLALLRTVLEEGTWQENRTGIRTLSYTGASMRYDLAKGFPAITVRKMAFKSAIAEMCGFLRGYDSADQFRQLGSKVWDQNANENAQWLANPYRKGDDHLGQIYGVQWRRWKAYREVTWDAREGHAEDSPLWKSLDDWTELADMYHGTIYTREIDQLGDCLRKIMETPTDRRIIFHGWNPAELDQMALPPCHLLYQFHPNVATREISLTLYVRSNDLGLGAPFNIVEAAALLTLVGRLTGYTPRIVTIMIGDAHIYENHLEMVTEILTREPLPSPTLVLDARVPEAFSPEEAIEWLSSVMPSDFELANYEHHEHITAPMAV